MRASWVDSGCSAVAAAVLMPRIATNREKALVMATSRSNDFRRLRMLSHFPEKDRLLRCVTTAEHCPHLAHRDISLPHGKSIAFEANQAARRVDGTSRE